MNEKQLESKETIEEVEKLIKEDINSKTKLNRRQRRSIQHKMGKRGRNQVDLISETSLKLNYIDLIQKLRKLNEKKENEENESIDSTEN